MFNSVPTGFPEPVPPSPWKPEDADGIEQLSKFFHNKNAAQGELFDDLYPGIISTPPPIFDFYTVSENLQEWIVPGPTPAVEVQPTLRRIYQIRTSIAEQRNSLIYVAYQQEEVPERGEVQQLQVQQVSEDVHTVPVTIWHRRLAKWSFLLGSEAARTSALSKADHFFCFWCQLKIKVQ